MTVGSRRERVVERAPASTGLLPYLVGWSTHVGERGAPSTIAVAAEMQALG